MVKRSRKNKLEAWEVALVKAMLASGTFGSDQDILAYFTRPSRSINHARILEIRTGAKHAKIQAATDEELKLYLHTWPAIDAASGLHIRGDELLIKAREAMLLAVQSYNNPKTHFRSEVFIVAAIIAWTYLFHAFYKAQGIDYRYKTKADGTVEVRKTKQGADKYWELGYCLKHAQCRLDDGTKRNLEFLIDIRHEIEHRMTTRIDEHLSAKLQACCLNFNRVLKSLFGAQYGLDGELSIALQFSAIDFDQRKALMQAAELPPHIEAVRASYEKDLTEEQYNDAHYAYRVLFVPKTANKKGQADAVMEFIKPGSEEAKKLNEAFLKEVEREKFRPGWVVQMMNKAGFPKFSMHYHTQLWQNRDAKNPAKGYGISLSDGRWYWYRRWVEEVQRHCEANREKYG